MTSGLASDQVLPVESGHQGLAQSVSVPPGDPPATSHPGVGGAGPRAGSLPAGEAGRASRRPPGTWGPRATFLAVAGVVTAIYVATFVRGLWWQWKGIILAQPAVAPAITDAPRGAVSRGASSSGAPIAPDPARKPLPRTDAPAPRSQTDDRGVTYDAAGVAVMGIDADPSGVYNVPPGRQVRIGGPAGTLYDVGDGGKLTLAKK